MIDSALWIYIPTAHIGVWDVMTPVVSFEIRIKNNLKHEILGLQFDLFCTKGKLEIISYPFDVEYIGPGEEICIYENIIANDQDDYIYYQSLSNTALYDKVRITNVKGRNKNNQNISFPVKMGIVKAAYIPSDSKCFVVTACAGSEDHELVNFYREFRKHYLYGSFIGELFVSFYALTGPSLAKIIKRSVLLRNMGFYLLSKLAHFLKN